MRTYDLLATRRRRWMMLCTLLVAGALVVNVTTDDGSGASGGGRGPTVTAEARDLATTLAASGTLQRDDESVVSYAGAITSDGGPTTPSGGNDNDDPSFLSTPTSSTTTSSTPTSSTTSMTTSTTTPCPTSGSSTPSPSSTTTTPSSSTSTTAPPTCPTTTTTPTTTAPPTTGPPSTDPSRPPGGDGGPGGDLGDGYQPGGSPTPAGNGGPGGGTPGGGEPGEGGEVPSATLTRLASVGTRADRGTVLYTADDQPIVALIGDLPAWRTLSSGGDDGADVQQLEENLVALGYGAGLDVDTTFDADTAAAVKAWETALGRADPDGTVTIGDVVFLSAPGDVLGHEASVGDVVRPGTPVLTIGSEQRVVSAQIPAHSAGGWKPGSTVELEWADGTVTRGTVFGVGRDAVNAQVELLIAVTNDATGAGDRRQGAAADVRLVDATRDDVIAVPVSAIVADGDGTAVRVAQDGDDRLVPVELGLVADGWVEITAGLTGGEEVRLPG